MYNNQRGVKTTTQKCKAKTIINIRSEAYLNDVNYSKSINEVLKQKLNY